MINHRCYFVFVFFQKHFQSLQAGQILSKACHVWYSSIITALVVTAPSGACGASWNCYSLEKHATQDEGERLEMVTIVNNVHERTANPKTACPEESDLKTQPKYLKKFPSE